MPIADVGEIISNDIIEKFLNEHKIAAPLSVDKPCGSKNGSWICITCAEVSALRIIDNCLNESHTLAFRCDCGKIESIEWG